MNKYSELSAAQKQAAFDLVREKVGPADGNDENIVKAAIAVLSTADYLGADWMGFKGQSKGAFLREYKAEKTDDVVADFEAKKNVLKAAEKAEKDSAAKLEAAKKMVEKASENLNTAKTEFDAAEIKYKDYVAKQPPPAAAGSKRPTEATSEQDMFEAFVDTHVPMPLYKLLVAKGALSPEGKRIVPVKLSEEEQAMITDTSVMRNLYKFKVIE